MAEWIIIFDLYLPTRIKLWEGQRRSEIDPIKTSISNDSTPIPIEMDRFWISSKNKQRFQQYFIEWFLINNSRCIPIYLGGGHKEGLLFRGIDDDLWKWN